MNRKRSRVVCTELPNHLIYNIFLNLPVKTLLQFRSLSKEWNKTITSRAFCKHHYIQYNNIEKRAIHLFVQFKDKCQFTHHNITHNFEELSWPPVRLQFPIQSNNYEFHPWPSSCNGLFCMSFTDNDSKSSSILVWNPFTRQSRLVSWPVKRAKVDGEFVGLGYDNAIDDYKIVVCLRIVRIYIMALRSNNGWRSVHNDLSFGYAHESKPVTINEDIYWLASSHNNLLDDRPYICNFNVSVERLTIMPCPRRNLFDDLIFLGQYGEYLCFFRDNIRIIPGQILSQIFNLYVYCKGGARWYNLMNVPVWHLLNTFDRDELTLCGFTVNGDLVCYSGDDLSVYLKGENRVLEVSLDELWLTRPDAFHIFQFETLTAP